MDCSLRRRRGLDDELVACAGELRDRRLPGNGQATPRAKACGKIRLLQTVHFQREWSCGEGQPSALGVEVALGSAIRLVRIESLELGVTVQVSQVWVAARPYGVLEAVIPGFLQRLQGI